MSARPVLVLIPGMTNTPRVFDRLIAHLGDHVEIRVVDVRGPADIANMAERTWRTLLDVGTERKLLVAGFSMGGYVALQMLALPLRNVEGLALICSTAHPDPPEAAPMRERAISSAARDWPRYVEKLGEFLMTPASQNDPSLRAAILADLHEAGAESTIAQMRAVMNRPDQRAMIRGLMLNALVVVGSDDPLIPIEDARATAQAIADAKFEALPGAGHLIPWEQPSELAALIRDWIRQTINEARAMSFADTLKSLPPITHLAALELLDAGGSTVAVIENKPGKAGSLAVYAALAARHGKIDPAAAREGLELFAEHTADARAYPGKHPNIDRLIEVIESGTVLGVRTVAL
jgi:pimeloyl-ACP methyl ester carboxylesterase